MALENKLGLTSSADLAREEERISKKKAVRLFESGTLDKLPVGTFASLKAILYGIPLEAWITYMDYVALDDVAGMLSRYDPKANDYAFSRKECGKR